MGLLDSNVFAKYWEGSIAIDIWNLNTSISSPNLNTSISSKVFDDIGTHFFDGLYRRKKLHFFCPRLYITEFVTEYVTVREESIKIIRGCVTAREESSQNVLCWLQLFCHLTS